MFKLYIYLLVIIISRSYSGICILYFTIGIPTSQLILDRHLFNITIVMFICIYYFSKMLSLLYNVYNTICIIIQILIFKTIF